MTTNDLFEDLAAVTFNNARPCFPPPCLFLKQCFKSRVALYFFKLYDLLFVYSSVRLVYVISDLVCIFFQLYKLPYFFSTGVEVCY